MRNINFYKQACLVLAMTGALSFTGCSESSYIPITATETNTIDTNNAGETSIEPRALEVGEDDYKEDFKLVVQYSISAKSEEEAENFKWRVTNDKNLNIAVHIIDLPEGYKVWIDNVHIDTFVEATNPYYNGILQDSMDDRIHNSLMMGFPINDTTYYSSKNLIAGQDKDFIEATFTAYCSNSSGYGSGEIKQQRYIDEDYLKKGVYANKITLVYGLLIQAPGETEPHGIDVYDEVHVYVYNCVEKYDASNQVINVYQYDQEGNATLIDSYSYEKPKSLSVSE